MSKAKKVPTQRKSVKGPFSEQLTIAIKALGLSAQAASNIVSAETTVSGRTFISHCRGERAPALHDIDRYASEYARALRTTKAQLLYGENAARINQLTQNVTEPPSHMETIRRMPFSAPFRSKPRAEIHAMSLPSLPFPIALETGPKCSAWRIPEGDVSMVGGEFNLAPNTFVIVDPDQDILPGQIVCCKPVGFDDWILRIFKSKQSYTKSKTFELVSPSPFFEVIKVRSATCLLKGRVCYSINQL